MNGRRQAPGFFGKLPSHGDFVGRRLPPEVRAHLDTWLQGALLRSKADLGDLWLPTWLNTPLWRFVLAAGVCGKQAWTGVMMPSHDQVGRCFPLLLAVGVDETPSLLDCVLLHESWFVRLEELALSSLDNGFALEAFDAALIALDGVPGASCRHPATPVAPRCRPSVVGFPTGTAPAMAAEPLEGRSAWWTNGSLQGTSSLAICSAMPLPTAFAALLDGRWAEHGWAVLEPAGLQSPTG
jgi:type VI secretion system protein ImpM